LKYYDEGAYDAASAELHRTMELRPSFKLYYNIAQVRVAMRDYAEALRAFRLYLDGGGDKISSANRQSTQKEMAQIEQRVSLLTVETDVPGVEVLVDDVPQGKTPLPAPLLVNSGVRRIAVRHANYAGQNQQVTLPGGVPGKLSFTLLPRSDSAGAAAKPTSAVPGEVKPTTSDVKPAQSVAPSPVAPLATSIRPEPPILRQHRVPWVAWAVTGTLTAGAAVAGIVALSANSSLKDERERFGTNYAELDSRATRVRTWAIAADGLAVAALVAGGVSLWMTVSTSPSESATARARSSTPTLRIGVGPQSVRVAGAF
jgi:hypothetical protein